MITGLAHRVVLAQGWRRRGIAFLAGATGALAMAPVDAWPVLVLPMTIAVWLIDGADAAGGYRADGRRRAWPALRSAAAAGWWWGLGYFVAGLWWMGSAFLVEADKFAWALPFGVLGLPAVAALYTALGFALARMLWMPGGGRVLSLAFGLAVAEWLRGTLLTGFPWNDLGMALGGTGVLAQAASVVGLRGLTVLAIALAAAPATLADPPRPGRRRALRSPVALAALALAGLAAFGQWRLTAGGDPGTIAGVKLRIMQPNLTQDEDFSYANKDAILKRYLDLSTGAEGLKDVTHLIWPESPFPFILARDPEALSAIAAVLPPGGVLITGAARFEGRLNSATTPPHYFNALQVVGAGGTILDTYDKVHLVPFGEYVPFESLLARLGVQQFVHIPGGFDPGVRHHLLTVPGLPPVAPTICYEAIFPGQVLPDAPQKFTAGVILNVTNDSWFGMTAGPYQHFAMARLRAIENGLPLIRGAGTGISAIVDPYGRIVASLPLGVQGVLDGPLPNRLAPTLFERYGPWILLAAYGLVLTIIISLKYRAALASAPDAT